MITKDEMPRFLDKFSECSNKKYMDDSEENIHVDIGVKRVKEQ